MSDGAHSDMHVFTICTMYCGMPEKPTWPWNMLTSLFVHTWSATNTPTKPKSLLLNLFIMHPLVMMIFLFLYLTFVFEPSWAAALLQLYKPKSSGWGCGGGGLHAWLERRAKLVAQGMLCSMENNRTKRKGVDKLTRA
jgi:hypothetical protein